jgi:hypothetical protein
MIECNGFEGNDDFNLKLEKNKLQPFLNITSLF